MESSYRPSLAPPLSTLTGKVFIAGHRGMVGSAIQRQLEMHSDVELLLRTHSNLDLTNQHAVDAFFANERPDHVIIAAAKVGGIWANNRYPADFIYQNLMIEANVIHAAYRSAVKQLLLLGSSCIYPRIAPQPMAEETLLTGTLEQTNEPYAIAKIAGIKLCESYNRQYGTDFRSVMPTNLYGPGDNFDLENSHVIPALMRKLHEAKVAQASSVNIWGTGKPRREFLHVNDMAAACIHVMGLPKKSIQAHTHPMLSHINIGTGADVSISELAEIIAEVVGFEGTLNYDTSKPDGTPQKLLDVSRLKALGWQAEISLREGLKTTYTWFLENQQSIRS